MATIKDVAELSGVTVTTVSRVLNNRGYLSEKTKKKVSEAIIALDYHPNEMARSLAQKQTSLLGVIVPSLLHPYYSECINALEKHASSHGLKLLVCNAQRSPQKEAEYIDMLKANKVAGLVLCTNSRSSVRLLANLPVVTLERSISSNVPAIVCDNTQGGQLAARHLIAQKCTNLVMISGNRSTEERANGFAKMCEQVHIPYKILKTNQSQFNHLDYTDLIQEIFTDPAVDGVFASSDVIATQVIQACHKKGLSIPEDMKIVGFDDVELSRMVSPRLTTIHQPIEELCKEAVQTIIDWDKERGKEQIILPVRLVQREST